ncbi:hypothetical protein N657DRAFT_670013 [Parathielavia appendiculata]|uniref:Cell surface protein n=1 Tax=Parathielavia appendiculata TaxID=2587402 RepID=A0AAN6U3K1_9PEZI|nr:hypothetical protein N657DRAFT_670013 [Parathielavia appendiculata]
MHPYEVLLFSLLATPSSAHGVVTLIRGANGVEMPGLSVADGTPRDCSTNRCGSQADTAIIRDREIRSGTVGPLGRTQGNGPIDAATMISAFMGTGDAALPRVNAANASVGVEDDLSGLTQGSSGSGSGSSGTSRGGRRFGQGGRNNNNKKRREEEAWQGGKAVKVARQFFQGLFGGGGTDSTVATESNVAAMAGTGASSGLPTCGDDGSIEMVFHQINQDGAGPLQAAIDGTSGGTDPDAFQTAQVTQDVPGFAGGLSLATSRDFPLTVQMPAGMTCDATVAGVDNVCIVRVRNGAAAGPFGGSAAFTQSPAARKRAIEYRLKKRAQAFKA